MSRLHGRNGRVYMALTSGGTAEPVAYLNAWTLNFPTEKSDASAFGDDNKVYTSGMPDASGTFAGWYDDASVQTYQAARDGVARKFYLYPTNANTGQYWFGTILPDFQAEGSIGETIKVQAAWNAASSIAKVG